MADEKDGQDEIVPSTIADTGEKVVGAMGGIIENGDEPQIGEQPASESIEPPTSNPLEVEVAPKASTEQGPIILVKVVLCGVCKEKSGKYKCSRCRLPYCSVPCNNIHKATHPIEEALAPVPKPPVTPKASGVARAGTVAGAKSKGPFAALDDSVEDIKELFKKFPHLSQQLLEIESASRKPTSEVETLAQLDLITQHTFECGKGYQNRNRPWDQNRGNDSGVQALRNARRVYGKDGEGVRIFGDFVLGRLCEEIVKERRDEDKRIVKGLLQVES